MTFIPTHIKMSAIVKYCLNTICMHLYTFSKTPIIVLINVI